MMSNLTWKMFIKFVNLCEKTTCLEEMVFVNLSHFYWGESVMVFFFSNFKKEYRKSETEYSRRGWNRKETQFWVLFSQYKFHSSFISGFIFRAIRRIILLNTQKRILSLDCKENIRVYASVFFGVLSLCGDRKDKR